MATTDTAYDPAYLDDPVLCGELKRVFDLCHGCRLWFNLRPSFPTMLALIDADGDDVSALTAADHDKVIAECHQCKLCFRKCPYAPPHEWQLDFPRLVMRARTVRRDQSRSVRDRVIDQALARTDLIDRVSVAAAPVINTLTWTPGSWVRKVMEKTAGVASDRLLRTYAQTRFSTRFGKRDVNRGLRSFATGTTQGQVSVFPTSLIEYVEPATGQHLVKVFERSWFTCSMPGGAACCGAPWLHQGNVKEFTEVATRNVASLVREVRAGNEVVVVQPTCGYTVKKDYPLCSASTSSAADEVPVAEHTADPAEYLVTLPKAADTSLDTAFIGRASGAASVQVICHVGRPGRPLRLGLQGRRTDGAEYQSCGHRRRPRRLPSFRRCHRTGDGHPARPPDATDGPRLRHPRRTAVTIEKEQQ